MNQRTFEAAALVAFLIGFSASAQASLIGDTVSAKQVDPVAQAQFNQPTALVSNGGPEFTLNFNGNVLFNVDIGGNFINITPNGSLNFILDQMEFSDLDWLPNPGAIIGITLTQAGIQNLSTGDISFTTNSVTIDLNGTIWQSSASATINLVTSHDVPEPGTLALIGIGLVGLGGLRRRKRVPRTA